MCCIFATLGLLIFECANRYLPVILEVITRSAARNFHHHLGRFVNRFHQKEELHMEHSKAEVDVIECVTAEAAEARLRELSELQLALVGGGQGEATPA